MADEAGLAAEERKERGSQAIRKEKREGEERTKSSGVALIAAAAEGMIPSQPASRLQQQKDDFHLE